MAERLLAFDTSTDRLSIAVRHGGHVVAHDGPGGAQSSTTLIPRIRALLAEAGLTLGALDAIVFGRGPGSFTGLRTACAVAQGLGYGADVPLLPVDTLHALAEDARHRFGTPRVVALLDARMGQVYVARVAFDGAMATVADTEVMAPESVVVPAGWVLAGNAFAAYGERLPAAAGRHEAWPTAEALLRLAPALLAAGRAVAPADAWPLYVRDKVAQTTEERAAAKAAAILATPAPSAKVVP